ncbi:MAG: hypothetical protein DCC55_40165 [Chloroflexi bacterium]|nr:MAG: hypothetical protein DCC55_40165 [Chloroflexota bacterium]
MCYARLAIVGLLLAVLSVGCGPQSGEQEEPAVTAITGGGAVLTPTVALPPSAPVGQFESPLSEDITHTAVLTTESPVVTPDPIATGWAVYTEPNGLSIEYPADWAIRTLATSARFDRYFESPAKGQIILSVYPLPPEYAASTDPYNWGPNEGGYGVHWGTPITVTDAPGWLFVWGFDNFDGYMPDEGLWRDGGTPTLMAMYYSEQNELDVRLTAFGFDDESTLMAQEVGLAATVAERFPIFDHMMKSVRFQPLDASLSTLIAPTATVTEGAPVATPALTATAWAVYTKPNGLSIEYPAGWSVRIRETSPDYSPDYHYLDSPGATSADEVLRERITLAVYSRALEFKGVTDLYGWMPKYGGYDVHWGTPIPVAGTTGLWQGRAWLMAVYYNEQNQLDVRLRASFDDESTRMAQEVGLAATVAERFPIFDHMMKSVRFPPPDEAVATPTAGQAP